MRGNILCSLKTLSGYEKPLKLSDFLCHVRAEQQWKGQTVVLGRLKAELQRLQEDQNLESSERGLP